MPEGVPSIDRVADQGDDRWPAAFTPGNAQWSGHLPTLTDAPEALALAYYRAAWQVLDGAPGPRAAALLDPVRTRAHLLAGEATDFRAVEAYVVLTGDLDLLAEKAGGATVLDRLRGLPDGGTVALDAARVGRARSLAALLRRLGERDEAAAIEVAAAEDARGVLARYAGGGRWRTAETPDDLAAAFRAVAGEMPEFLDLLQRGELVEFADRQLGAEPPGGVAYALCRLGRPDRAAVLLAGAASPGAAELEAILGGLFAIRADFPGWEAGSRRVTRPGLGRLENLPAALT
ncbi:hypothetical protein Ais01nite_36050 [Asanoa ishikariensis]|uniref:Uncharacterized protein n=1 Tax=Asanoa ishikariensis TaxID=137265 RepID=A0A1H3LMZ0_9ACTN|nr:hypothetical protein [Asanoa ishikariensis]GIF65570.1 hypothetical protein Ais01nite_36050 [Asanoa ishikariensis]SDY65489.1 hypothetical protein SAMN05421684_0844 [Asanoa ishikariensis]